MTVNRKELLNYYATMIERERIRVKKERGDLPPWTEDPTLRKFRFCNVWRQDDRVSRDIKATLTGDERDNILRISAGRMVINSDTIHRNGLPGVADLNNWARRARADKDWKWGIAYRVFAHVPSGTKRIDSFIPTLRRIRDLTKSSTAMLREKLLSIRYIGDFLAYE